MSKNNGFQLHQLLAAANDRDKQAVQLMIESTKTFEAKSSHFDGRFKQYQPDDEGAERLVDEVEEVVIVGSVKEKLDYTNKFFINALDSILSKEETNASGNTSTEIVIGTNKFQLSSIGLLALEKKMISLRGMYKKIPTLDPTKQWTYNEEKQMYETKVYTRNRIAQKNETIVVVQATDKFPAQTQVVPIQKKTGVYEETFFSKRITVRQKAEMIGRIDEIIDSIQVARAKANKAEVIKVKIGAAILNYVNKGLK